MSAPTLERRGRFSAENLHAMGLFPFPLHDPDSDDPRAFKRPRWGGWQTTALESTASQRKTWDQVGFNLGLYLAPSRLVVIDTDSPEAEAWAAANLPKAPWMVQTAHGFHRYYRLAPGAAAPPDNRPMAGLALDVKAHGYTLAPGSWHHGAGAPYEPMGDWHVPPSGLPVYNPKWFPLRMPVVQARGGDSSPSSAPDEALRATRYIERLPPAVQGQDGHGTLLRACLKVLTSFQGLSAEEIEDLLWTAFNPRCIPPWSESERQDFARKVREAQRILGRRVA